MPVSPNKNAQFETVRVAIESGVRQFLTKMSVDWPDEPVYGLLLEVNCEGDHVFAAAATEAGLTRVAKRYAEKGYRAKKGGDTLTLLCKELRWGSPEDGWYADYEAPFFAEANSLLSKLREEKLIEYYDGRLEKIAIDALRQLDADGVFGVGNAREKIVVGLCYFGGDNSDAEFLQWAKKVNPESVMKRLRTELKECRAVSSKISTPYDK